MSTSQATESTNGREMVKDYILTQFKEGQKLPKIRVISNNLGTSVYAAERALTELSAEGYVERRPRFGSVRISRPSQDSSDLLLPKIHSIAFMADEIESFLAAEIMRGVDVACREHKMMLSLLNSDYSSETEKKLIKNLTHANCSGAVVRVGEHKENLQILEEMVPDDFPLVLVDRSDLDVRFPCVKMDQEKAGFDATNHLIELGHERIAHITYDSSVRPLLREMQKRKEGYQMALCKAGLPAPPDYVQEGALFTAGEHPGPSYYESLGYAPMNRLLLQKQRPTAVFLLYFHFVFGALKAIHDHGLKVPDDISLICIDDEPLAAHLNPPVTVYAQPLREIGFTAAEILIDMIDGKDISEKTFRLEGELIQRGSTGPVKK
ncbi:Glucose-resistance amylase regulator [Limihaloglobus sulfuriphilus]|uniref:Glucose-resistance amylase regulator n=1 Tax=Limihaloglobus sulfuriphilus TaxID=1851148 RepID=A0A1Q2MEB0_9BACT|nr:substrate-binding domain-containing protein [Limihaloglobus sulfuriphilus]AQQ71035.1 Glucose-resistance amylase regulator [Limihaloglobus sulfuriphilus]